MSKKNIVLIGGGGHCKSVIEAIRTDEHIEIIGILDTRNIHSKILNVPVIGDDTIIMDLINQHYQFLITVGNIGLPDTRIKLYEHVRRLHGTLATVISSNALTSKSCSIGEGTIIMQKAMVNAEAIIGNNCIINTGALIEHETRIGDNVHISTGAIINGQCQIGKNCFIGSGSIIGNNVTLADNVIIGAGSIVLRSINEAGTYFGQPASIKQSKETPNV